jgi:hypothetical protein
MVRTKQVPLRAFRSLVIIKKDRQSKRSFGGCIIVPSMADFARVRRPDMAILYSILASTIMKYLPRGDCDTRVLPRYLVKYNEICLIAQVARSRYRTLEARAD